MVQFHIKVIPGASRDRVAGRLGDAWKVQVSAAAERGRANEAVVRVLAAALNVPSCDISIVRGQANPRKLVQVRGLDQADLQRRLGSFL